MSLRRKVNSGLPRIKTMRRTPWAGFGISTSLSLLHNKPYLIRSSIPSNLERCQLPTYREHIRRLQLSMIYDFLATSYLLPYITPCAAGRTFLVGSLPNRARFATISFELRGWRSDVNSLQLDVPSCTAI